MSLAHKQKELYFEGLTKFFVTILKSIHFIRFHNDTLLLLNNVYLTLNIRLKESGRRCSFGVVLFFFAVRILDDSWITHRFRRELSALKNAYRQLSTNDRLPNGPRHRVHSVLAPEDRENG